MTVRLAFLVWTKKFSTNFDCLDCCVVAYVSIIQEMNDGQNESDLALS